MPQPVIIARHVFTTSPFVLRTTTGGVGPEDLVIAPVIGDPYYLMGNGAAEDLAQLIEDALNTNTGGGVYTVTINDLGLMTIACTVNYQIFWLIGSFDRELTGFTATAPAAPGLTSTSSRTIKTWWIPGREFMDDNEGEPEKVIVSERTMSGKTLTVNLGTDVDLWRFRWKFIDQSVVIPRWAGVNIFNTIRYLWDSYLSLGYPFRVLRDVTDRNTYYQLRYGPDFPLPYTLETDKLLTSYFVSIEAREDI